MAGYQARQHCLVRLILPFLLSGVLLQSAFPSMSQAAFTSAITPDGTLGTTVAKIGNVYDINGGTIKGTNQFHSFGLFSVGTGDIASFNGPSSIANILSRVTGGQQSMIDGTLRSTIQGANLYLMNPAGVLFGPNASLDLTGSFHVTTADYLRLADNVQFLAKPDAVKDSLLTTALVAAFGFLSSAPALVSVQGSSLEVQPGQTLSIIAGDIAITDGAVLKAAHGQINMASVASSGEVMPNQPGSPSTLDVSSFATLGTIIADSSNITVSSELGSGTMLIRGGQLIVTNGAQINANTMGNFDGTPVGIDIEVTDDLVVTNSAVVQAFTNSAGRTGNVQIVAGNAETNRGSVQVTNGGRIFSTTDFGSTGNAGQVTVTAKILTVEDGGQIDSSTFGSGNAGAVSVTVSNALVISGAGAPTLFTGIASQAAPGNTGNAGEVTVSAKSLTVQDGGAISSSTFGSGNAGAMSITASDTLLISSAGAPTLFTGLTSGVAPDSTGNGGQITVTARALTVQDGGQVSSSTFGSGNAGAVFITAKTLTVQDAGSISSGTLGSGNAGAMSITASDTLVISGAGAQSLFTGIASQAAPGSTGNAGQVTVAARIITLQDAGVIATSTFGSGNAGAVSVTASDDLVISGTAAIVSQAARGHTGNAGQIIVTAKTLTIQDGGAIDSSTFGGGNAGAVSVKASDALVISGAGAPTLFTGIASDASFGSTGNAGQVSVTAKTITLQDAALIVTDTFGSGNAGAVSVTASDRLVISGAGTPTFFTGIASDANAGSTGNAGQVAVIANTLTMQDGGKISSSTLGSGNAGEVLVQAAELTLSRGAQIRSNTLSAGVGGTVTVNAENVGISGTRSGLFTNSIGGSGQGGDIQVRAGNVTLADGATISASSTGTGNAGNILIQAGDFVARNSFVTTEALQADGGNIELQVGHLVHLTHSDVTTSVGSGAGNGGNITIDPQFFIVDHSRIVANAFGGKGGNINISAGVFLTSPDSLIDASSALGINGTVNIQSPVTNLSGTLAALPQGFLQAAGLLARRCAARMGGTYSTFVVAGHDGLPLEPGGLLPSPLYEAAPAGALAAAPAQEAPGAAEPVLERVLVAFHEPLLRPGRIWKPEGSPVALDLGCGS